jgi:hypothetical protein
MRHCGLVAHRSGVPPENSASNGVVCSGRLRAAGRSGWFGVRVVSGCRVHRRARRAVQRCLSARILVALWWCRTLRRRSVMVTCRLLLRQARRITAWVAFAYFCYVLQAFQGAKVYGALGVERVAPDAVRLDRHRQRGPADLRMQGCDEGTCSSASSATRAPRQVYIGAPARERGSERWPGRSGGSGGRRRGSGHPDRPHESSPPGISLYLPNGPWCSARISFSGQVREKRDCISAALAA